MSNMKFKGLLAGASLVAMLTFGAGAASAATLSLSQITNNTAVDASSQLGVSVVDGGTLSSALFTFTGLSGTLTQFAMAELYWSDLGGIFVPPPTLVESSNGDTISGGGTSQVSYSQITSPGGGTPNLPGAPSASPSFVATAMLAMDADPAPPAQSVGIGEFATFGLAYDTGFDFDDVIADLKNGNLRIGIHVIDHRTGSDDLGSESYVGGGCIGADCGLTADPPAVIPLPAGLPLILTGLGVFGALRLRKRKTA